MRTNVRKFRLALTSLVLVVAILVAAAGTVTAWADENDHPIASPFDAEPTSQSTAGSSSSLGVSLAATAAAHPVDVDAALIAGAYYLKHAQADVTENNAENGNPDVDPQDGGWDWVLTFPNFIHSANASSTNLYGATAMGLYYAYLETGDASYMTAMQDAATYMIGDADIDSAADLVFLMRFQDLTGVTADIYKAAAKTKFDAKITTYVTATGLAEYIRDLRAGQGYENGIIPWDIGAWVVAAQMLEDRYPSDTYDYAQAADDMAEVVYEDSYEQTPFGYFDLTTNKNNGWDPLYGNLDYYWYSLGISGLIDAFVAADVHMDKIPDLVTLLLDCQYPGGAFSYCYGANTDDEDWQSTAYAVMSLARVNQTTYQTEINYATYWLGATQDAGSGGWVYSSGNHYPEVGGECTAALSFGQTSLWVNPCGGWVEDGENVTLDVMMTSSGFNGVEFDLEYDDSLLTVVSVVKGSMWDGYDTNVMQATGGSGTIEFAAFLQDADTTLDVTQAQVATITFTGLADGESALTFANTIVSNPDGEELGASAKVCTLTVHGHGTVTGDVELQGRFVAGGSLEYHKDAKVTITGGPGGGFSYDGYTDVNGHWEITLVTEGNYNVEVEMDRYLNAERSASGQVTLSAGGSVDAGFIKLLGGDCDGNARVGSLDASIVGFQFGNSHPTPGIGDMRADINDDHKVNILDCAILGGNYGKAGPLAW